MIPSAGQCDVEAQVRSGRRTFQFGEEHKHGGSSACVTATGAGAGAGAGLLVAVEAPRPPNSTSAEVLFFWAQTSLAKRIPLDALRCEAILL